MAEELFIYDEIGEGWFGGLTDKDFQRQLEPLKGQDIDVHIDSPGGDVFQGIAIANMLDKHDGHVRVIIDGVAASIASVIAMAGTEIVAPSNTMMMIHDPWTITMGNSAEHTRRIALLDKIKAIIVDTYMSRATETAEKLGQLMADETWLTAAEAKEIGLVDEVTEFGKGEARASLSRFEGLYNRIPKDAMQRSLAARAAMPKDKLKPTWNESMARAQALVQQFQANDLQLCIRRDRKPLQAKIDDANDPPTPENAFRRRINTLKTSPN